MANYYKVIVCGQFVTVTQYRNGRLTFITENELPTEEEMTCPEYQPSTLPVRTSWSHDADVDTGDPNGQVW
jgi:hypothetical protein